MSPFDSQKLLALARQNSTAGRNELANAVSDLFDGEGDSLTERERALMYEILHQVVRDAEMEVRKIISTRLAARGDAPSDLINVLANDDVDVAFPILTKSAVLRDVELIEIVRNRTIEHQMAVSIRDQVSEDVSSALVDTGDERVIRSLLQNDNARLSEVTMEFLVEQSQRVDSFQEPILHRKELRPEMAKRMFLWVSAALRNYIVSHCGLSQSDIDDLMEDAAHEVVDEAVSHADEHSKSDQLAEELHRRGEATPELMIKALREGEVRLFVDLMEKASGIREDLIMRFVTETTGEGLAVASRYVGLDEEKFKEVFKYCRMARPNQRDNMDQRVADAAVIFNQITDDTAKEVVRRWRRDASYLAALRDLEVI